MENKIIGIANAAAMLVTVMLISGFMACKKTSDTTSTTNTTTTTTIGTGVPDVYKKIYGATSITVEGSYIVIKATSLPDHKSPYYQNTQWASTRYEAYNGTNTLWNQNPNTIAESDCTYKIPMNPTVATTHASTPLGPMGVAVNGVPIFNQYAAGGAALTGEINSFDQYDGHPQQQGQYHYHAEPYYITTTKGKDALLGFLLDGFPVYGPTEGGKTIANSDLDVYHGHTGVTADYPNGIYHYHVTNAAPYINGNGFYGTAGTITQ